MTTPHDVVAAASSHRRRRRLTALAVAALTTAASVAASAAPASAEPVDVTDATFEWAVSTEVQSSNPAPGTCPYLSAGQSDGTQATYLTTSGNVSILKNGAAPTWTSKCEGAALSQINQKIVWSGGTGTADPETGAATISFTGQASVNFYSGMVPFSIVDPVLTVDADGDGRLVASLVGYASSLENPGVKTPLPPVSDIVLADLTDVDITGTGLTVTPDFAGVTLDVPEGQAPQNRTTTGWGSWPPSFVGFHLASGLGSYWYTSGGAADPRKPPLPITFSYSDLGGEGEPEPGDGQQTISVVVPPSAGQGEFVWSISGDGAVTLTDAASQGTYLQATGQIDPISVTDTRTGGPEWSISGQISDFTGGLPAKYLGWTPTMSTEGAGIMSGGIVQSGLTAGNGLADPSLLAAAPAGHAAGTAVVGADLDLRLPVETPAGTYTATLTITALS